MIRFRIPILVLIIPGLAGGCAFLPLGSDNPFRPQRDSIGWSNSSTDEEPSRPRLGDIATGMSMQEVTRTWGEPRHVQYAGPPEAGNQRWVYPEGPAAWKTGGSRTLYFEDGQVVGWESGGP